MRTVTAAGIDLFVVELCDRRQGLGNPLREWCFQSELENYLYSNWQTRGSFFKLLSRAGADGQSLCLRRKAVDEGLVTPRPRAGAGAPGAPNDEIRKKRRAGETAAPQHQRQRPRSRSRHGARHARVLSSEFCSVPHSDRSGPSTTPPPPPHRMRCTYPWVL